jgi:hypothetical protein
MRREIYGGLREGLHARPRRLAAISDANALLPLKVRQLSVAKYKNSDEAIFDGRFPGYHAYRRSSEADWRQHIHNPLL